MTQVSNKLRKIDQIASRYREQIMLDELRRTDVQVEVYFDTYHILPLLQGYWELQRNVYNDIDVTAFKNDRFLVKSLVYFGYIKNLKILLPHAVELKNQLDKSYLLPSDNIDQQKIKKFLESIGLDDLEKLTKLAKDDYEGYISKLEPRTEDIFKANYILDKLIWTKRYRHLFDNNPIIQYDTSKYNNADILQSRLFQRILDALATSAETRKYKTVNNLRDAMALCMFQQKVKQFKKTKILPLFYVTGSVLSKLESSLLEEFTITHGDYSINTLKDTEFFIVDSMFSSTTPKSEGETFMKMTAIKSSLEAYRRIGENYPEEKIDLLVDDWDQFRKNDFFEKLWPESKVNFNKNIVNLIEYDHLVKNEETFKKIIERDREKIGESIDSRVNDLVLLEDIWKSVEGFNDVITEILNERRVLTDHRPGIFQGEALTRFSPPAGRIEDEIKQLWQGFLDCHFAHDEITYDKLKVRLTRIIYEGFLIDTKIDYNKVLIGLNMLWVFHKDDLIIRLVKRLNDYGQYYQIPLIYMASMLRLRWQTPTHLKTMTDLIECIESKDWYARNYKAWLGIAYIKFNIWKINQPVKSPSPAGKWGHYFEDSIRLIEKVLNYLSDKRDVDDEKVKERNVKYYYSLNNYIYYSLHREKMDFSDLDFYNYVNELVGIQTGNEYSQGRFSDTIAYFYYCKAMANKKNKQSSLDDITFAETHCKNAMETSLFKDGRFLQLSQRINILKQHLESS